MNSIFYTEFGISQAEITNLTRIYNKSNYRAIIRHSQENGQRLSIM